MLGKDMKIEEQNAQYVQEFLDNEIVRLGELIEEYKANVKVMGEDFNMDNPNGGMYSGMELTEIHHEMEKQFLYSDANQKKAEEFLQQFGIQILTKPGSGGCCKTATQNGG